MAEFLAELARRALVLSGLAVLLDVVLPQGSMRRLSRLVLSMLLLAAFIEPVVQAVGGADVANVSATVFAGDGRYAGRDNTEEIIEAGARLAAGANEEALANLAHNMEQEIAEYVREQAGVSCRVEVELGADAVAASSGDAGGVLVLLAVDEAAAQVDDLRGQVAARVAACYGLSAGDVRVSLVKYGENLGENLGEDQ